jgi:hypothetical protein
MAVTDAAALETRHFDPAEFNALIEAHGADAQLRIAHRCGCWDANTGRPDPACISCYPYGYLYDPVTTVKVWGPNRKGLRHYLKEGTVEVGDAFFTFKTGMQPTHYSRIVLPLSTLTVDDILTKGSEDRIRWAWVLAVQGAKYNVRNPPTGSPYTTDPVALQIEGVGTPPPVDPDIAISGNTITWLKQNLPDGTRYVVRFDTYAEYSVWEPQDRNEGGLAMPYRYLCKRLDYLTHPRSADGPSYAA